MHAPLQPVDEHHDVADALRALPLEAPPTSVWPALAKAVSSNRRANPARGLRPAWAAAAATAGVAVAIAWLVPRHAETPTLAASAPDLVTDDADARLVADLVARNQALERALRDSGSAVALDADYAMAGSQVEELIAAVDAQLAAGPEPRSAEVLWRVRLGLLQELSSLRSGGSETLLAGTSGVIAVPADDPLQ